MGRPTATFFCECLDSTMARGVFPGALVGRGGHGPIGLSS